MKLNFGKLIKAAAKAAGPLVITLVSAKAQGAIEKAAGKLAKKVTKR